MAPVVDIVDVTEIEGTSVVSEGTTRDESLIKECLDTVFQAVDQSPEMFMRCCLEYVESRTRLLSQRGCEQNMVRLMEAVRLGSGSSEEGEGDDRMEADECETVDLVEKHRGQNSPSSSSSSEKAGQQNIGPGHGAVHENYSWTQTLSEVSIVVPIPRERVPIKGKDCRVKIQRDHVSIGIAGCEDIVAGPLFAPVRVDDCMWNLVDSNTIEVSLTKIDAMKWWKCVIQGEPEIDTTKIEPEPSGLSDLDPEMRSTVEKMMYDQQQQALLQNSPSGRAETTEDKQDAIKKFMEAHPELDFSEAVVDMS